MSMSMETIEKRISGWVVFASVLLVLAGIFGMINGLRAIIDDKSYLVTENNIIAFDYTQWGWIHLIVGAIVLAAGLALTSGAIWARIIAVIAAMVSAVAQIGFLDAQPYWGLIVIAIDLMIIYSVIVHGRPEDVVVTA